MTRPPFTRSLIRPTVSLSGSPARMLIEQIIDVRTAIRAVQEAMAKASPHGRDYQNSRHNGENMVYAAMDAWRERSAMLATFYEELEQLAVDIQDQSLPPFGSGRRIGEG